METIEIVGVVGAGTMGMGIAEVAAAHGQKALVFDVDEAFAHKAHEALQNRLKKRVIRGKITQQDADKISHSIKVVKSLSDFLVCDLVVEAVVENLDVKKQIFTELESIVSESALLASNTSSLSITAIASAMKEPSRLFGLHFFNPAPVMKLVELIKGLQTDAAHLNVAKALCSSWGKKAVIAQSTPGFIVNRVARPFYGEALKMCQEKLATFVEIDAVLTQGAGFRMGPFELMDLIGIDINYAVSQSVYKEMFNDPRFKPSLLQGEMVHANTLGRKSGQGFYDYTDGVAKVKPDFTYSEVSFDEIIVPDEMTLLSRMFSEFEYDNRKWHGEQIIVGGCQIVLSNGQTAKQIEQDSATPTCVVDLSFDFKKSQCVNLAFGPGVNEFMRNRVISLINYLGKNVIVSKDQPGLIALRTIVMLINEAADAVFNGVCSAKDVDLAMRYGVNYPKGLLAFAEELGWQHVADSLQSLQNWFGDDRYRLSPYIRNQL
ncbi:3-hydroxyacyl-CoA dehydrogenase [Marinicella litoralis]|uniref:3-hydroxyacyl-CoA dehydrogenase n=1 Tax=Marinicella litoralis TaxID=644220 RepID=A0A4R6XKT0_9GAMM|nr:3-hydroxyacyl-CoA dehydrogenase [Marinicella litoralis]TDR18514.1 3-hydroxyacyl-CoA dehydrogenase [Marinicella litoralis]